MELSTEVKINDTVKKYFSFTIFLALLPIIFIQLIAFLSGEEQLNNLLFYIAPLSSVTACGYFIKSVLIDVNTNKGTKAKQVN